MALKKRLIRDDDRLLTHNNIRHCWAAARGDLRAAMMKKQR